jgi:hypothetical protein
VIKFAENVHNWDLIVAMRENEPVKIKITGNNRGPNEIWSAALEFIDENGGGPGVRLRKPPKQKR